MHILLLRLLQGAAVAVLVLVIRVVLFLAKCFLAHKQYVASPVPGPPVTNKITGEQMCYQPAAGLGGRTREQFCVVGPLLWVCACPEEKPTLARSCHCC